MAENSLFQEGFSQGFDDLFDEDKFNDKSLNSVFFIIIFSYKKL